MEQAKDIAKTVVEAHLAACAQVLPIHSYYTWQGELAEDDEYLLFLKTRAEVYDRLEAAILQIHEYDVPEILASPVLAGSASYLQWIDQSVQSGL